jgi:hypothetical protein
VWHYNKKCSEISLSRVEGVSGNWFASLLSIRETRSQCHTCEPSRCHLWGPSLRHLSEPSQCRIWEPSCFNILEPSLLHLSEPSQCQPSRCHIWEQSWVAIWNLHAAIFGNLSGVTLGNLPAISRNLPGAIFWNLTSPVGTFPVSCLGKFRRIYHLKNPTGLTVLKKLRFDAGALEWQWAVVLTLISSGRKQRIREQYPAIITPCELLRIWTQSFTHENKQLEYRTKQFRWEIYNYSIKFKDYDITS